MEHHSSSNPEASADAQALVLRALLTACAKRMPGLSDELLALIAELSPAHEAAMGSAPMDLYRELLEQWKVDIFNLPAAG